MSNSEDLIALDLTDDESAVLRAGLDAWGGPARATQEIAVAIGFRDQGDLLAEGDRIRIALETRQPLSPLDWARAVLATEIAFASQLVGSGEDWEVTTGFSDADTIRILRQIQRNLPRRVYAVVRSELGTKPPGQRPS
jgi:hypothetical protein